MSLILDALRKMEQDRNSRRGSALDIRPEVLRYRAASRKRPRTWLPWAIGAVLLACGTGAGFFLKGNHATPVSGDFATAPPPPTAAVSTAPVSTVAPTIQVDPTASVAPVAPVATVPVAPAAPALTEVAPTRVPASIARPQAVPVSSVPAVRSAPLRRPVAAAPAARPEEPVGKSRVKPAHREESGVTQGAPADIAITGIAWQDERSLRRAVINGTLVGEGAEIAGAHVIEIREDKVRLSRGGQVFDAAFSAGSGR
jgi:general secretion pathway protein B